MQTDKRVETKAHTNKQMGGDRSTYEQTKGWGHKHIQTNNGRDRSTYKQNKEVGTEA